MNDIDEAKKHIWNLLKEVEEIRGPLALASDEYLQARKFVNSGE